MGIKTYRPIILTILGIVMVYNLHSQCDFPGETLIADEDTTSISFLIEGAVNNDLSTNRVCGVRLGFSHEYVGDLSVYLISPSGQEVQLIGPSNLNESPLTTFINWDVTFVPCGDPASPDQGLFPIWDNEGNWIQFNNYNGVYYPHNGCLEDFNSGPVNGTWTLRIEDALEFGEGVFTQASIFFCDDTGIDCESCVAFAGEFNDLVVEVCEGNSDLVFYPDISFDIPPPVDLYDYRFIILDDNGYVAIQDTVDLRGFSPATYQICGLSIENTQLSELSIPLGMQKSEIEKVITNNRLCADLSNECISFTILDVLDTLLISQTICEGSSYEFNGITYDSPGFYLGQPTSQSCDTITILQLNVYPISANITGGDQLLSCTNSRISLDGSGSSAQDAISYLWRTDGGLIRTDSTQSGIVVSQTGIYYLDVSSNGCVVTDTVEIYEDGSAIEIDLVYDSIDCINPSTSIDFNSSVPVANVIWSGAGAFSNNGNDIVVSIPGEYRVTVTGTNGCVAFDTAHVVDNTDVENPQFGNTEITCINEIITPGMTFLDSVDLGFSWSGPSGFTSDQQNPLISSPGFYTVTVTGSNGCTEISSIAVNDLRSFATIATFTDTLTCAKNQVSIGVTSNDPTVRYNWSGPLGFTSDQQNPIVDQEGVYTITVTTNDECETTADVVVAIDERLPAVTVQDITISCADGGSIPLQVTSDAINPIYNWSGPGGFTGSGSNPMAGIIGEYSVNVTGSNGCARSATMSLVPGSDIPDVFFVSDTLDCEQPTVDILPSDTTGFSFSYIDPSGINYSNTIPSTTISGQYTIRVSQGACFSDYVHQVEVDSVFPSLIFDVEEIDCDSDSVSLDFIANRLIREGQWTGPDLFVTNEITPYVKNPGLYVIEATAFNGCQVVDTVNVGTSFDLPMIQPENAFFTCISDEVSLTANVTNMATIAYNWEGPDGFTSSSDSPTTTVPGVYHVSITGSNGCIKDTSLVVDFDTISALVNLSVDTILTCPDPVSTLTAVINENNVSTTWYGPQDTLSGGLTLDVGVPGLWEVIVIDGAGCVSSDTVVVGTDIIYPEVGTTFNTIDCINPESAISIIRDAMVDSILWQAPIAIDKDLLQFSTDQTGEYIYTLFTDNGCDTMVSFEVLIDTVAPVFDLGFSDTITCTQPTIDLIVNTSDSLVLYNWIGEGIVNTEGSVLSVSNPGLFQLQAFKTNGCSALDSVQVPIDTVIPEIVAVGDTMSCRTGRRAILEVSTNIEAPQVLWSNDSGFSSTDLRARVTESGIYSVEVKGANGCLGRAVVEVLEDFAEPRVFVDEISYLLCDSTASKLGVTSDATGVTYAWYGPGNFFSQEQSPLVDSVGTYIVYIRGENGCRVIDSTQAVIDTRTPQYNLVSENIICTRDTADITLDFTLSDNVWMWQGPDGFTSTNEDLRVTQSGTYILSVEGSNRCVARDSVEILDDTTSPMPMITNEELIQCTNRRITLDGSGSSGDHNLLYAWSTTDGIIVNGDNSAFPLIEDPGTYQLLVRDVINGCKDSLSITVVETPQEFLDFEFTTTDPSCPGYQNGSIAIDDYAGGYKPFKLSVDGSDFTIRQGISFLDVGVYQVVIRDSLGCEVEKEIEIFEPRMITLDLGPDTLIGFGDSIKLVAMTNVPEDEVALFEWSPLDEIACLNCFAQVVRPLETTTYRLNITDINGCTEESKVVVRVANSPDIILPNIFRPNSPNDNGVFYIRQTKGIEQINYLSIYDRWGNRMYHAENFAPGNREFGWNGNFQGLQVRPGVFAVIMEIKLQNGQTRIIETDLTLIR